FSALYLVLPHGYVFAEEAKAPLLKKEEAVAVPGHKEMGCMACHRTAPKSFAPKDRTELLTGDINSLCKRCHDSVAVVREGHHLEPTPYTEKELISELDKLKLPLSKGNITCITCHNPHASPPEKFFLYSSYLEFSDKAKWINPHWSERLCAACHSTRPASAKDLNFKFEGDFIKICNVCHEVVSAQSLEHSVGMVPSPEIMGRIPKEFSLSRNGEMTCITCHELKYQCLKEESRRKGTNPKFFRGGPYTDRTDICYKCHAPTGYERLNPHDQINDEGELITDRCLYCHTGVPNAKTDSIKKVRFQMQGNLKGLCQRCHRDRPHPGGSLARPTFDHMVKPSREVWEWKTKAEREKNVVLALEPGVGRVFCCTCHNPHERGVQRKIASDKGSDGRQRLRLNDGYDLCESCHGWSK
ncbi:MAG: hypothetical protein AAB275_05625, partial [Deltaproteobacteria bacterium]